MVQATSREAGGHSTDGPSELDANMKTGAEGNPADRSSLGFRVNLVCYLGMALKLSQLKFSNLQRALTFLKKSI